mgnify:CR=1 FL=1
MELEEFPGLMNCLQQLPAEFQKSIDEQYMRKHIRKSKGIARIKISIRQVKITRMTYKMGDLVNKKYPKKGTRLILFHLSKE